MENELKLNNNLDRFLELDIMGEKIKVLKKVGMEIPFIEAIISTQPDNIVVLDNISPAFFNLLVEYLRDGRSLTYLKNKLHDFNKDNVMIWLKYLGLNKLYKNIFGCRFVNKKLAVIDAIVVYDSKYPGREFVTYFLCDGNYISKIDPYNALVRVIVSECTEEDERSGFVKGFMIKTKTSHDAFFRDEHVIKDDDDYYVTFIHALRFEILSNAESIKCKLGID